MHLDVHQLRDFYYRSQLGRAAQKGVRDHMVRQWGPCNGLAVAGYGFAVPLLRPFLSQAARVIGLMPAPQGVMPWPPEGPNHSILCDEARWPLANDSIDRLVMMHGLETCDHPVALLDEAHRVLAPRGKAMIIVPSRSGIWARRDVTPFGVGRPYSRSQIEDLLSECGFVPQSHSAALFFPPSARPFWLRSARSLERMGRRFAPERFGGVLMIEAVRRDAPMPRRGLMAEARPPLRVLDGVPQGGALPAWRDTVAEGSAQGAVTRSGAGDSRARGLLRRLSVAAMQRGPGPDMPRGGI